MSISFDRHVPEDFSPDRMVLGALRVGKRWALGPTPYPRDDAGESRRVKNLTPDGDVYGECASGQGRDIEGIRWSENRALPSGTRPEVRTLSDASSETFNFAALRRPQRLRHGLTSIDGTQVPLLPWMEFGGRSRGALELGPPPVVARGEGDWRALETVEDTKN